MGSRSDSAPAQNVWPRGLHRESVAENEYLDWRGATEETLKNRYKSEDLGVAEATCNHQSDDELSTYGIHPSDPQWAGVTKVIIRNIPTRCRIGELQRFIAKAVKGDVCVNLPMKGSKKNRGYAFLKATDASVAREAVAALWQKPISSRVSDRPLVLLPGYEMK
eukprot:gb/GFBE01055479.1/.p1 GENE.gb/GFBE01055479.1/~~gb/GFBE01055479.1/.p1  ORF type:complete len:164 (+),score=16.72 gb/GFBE01055479.1/:1-492(+)